jgi:hypothetical protein
MRMAVGCSYGDMIDAEIAEYSKLAGETRRQLSDIAVR